jgi:type IV pilus assembly protein PilA
MAASPRTGPQLEDSLEKLYQLSQYLGDELVVSAAPGAAGPPNILVLAEVRKPGLKVFLEQMMAQLPSTAKPPLRVLDQRSLTAAKEDPSLNFTILVRADFVIGASDLSALRAFNAHLDHADQAFATTPFGQRLADAYRAGITVLAAADLQKIVSQIPLPAEQKPTFQRTGFADLKYVLWAHRGVAGQAASEAELSFTGPRHGIASWLAAPRELGSLDFVSSTALVASTVLLKNLADVFEDVRELATASNPNAFAMMDQMQQGMGIDLKKDLLSHLPGEVTLEIDKIDQTEPLWRAVFQANDPVPIQQTLTKLLTMSGAAPRRIQEAGITYNSLEVPSPNKTIKIIYAFVDGYLVIGPTKEVVADSVRVHRTGGSLRTSKTFLAAMPGHSPQASAILYEDPATMAALQMHQLPPELRQSLAHLTGQSTPVVVAAYGDETSIREASTSSGIDAGVVLVAAAIAIPNLLRARTAANESSAVATMRTLITAQISYSAAYPEQGFARDLASLGTNPANSLRASPEHAGLIESTLGNSTCTVGKWCEKSGYRFTLTAVCAQHPCEEFVAVATPVSTKIGMRSFCATSDGVVRYKTGPPLAFSISASRCKAWLPLQ